MTWALVNALEYDRFGHALLGASTWVQVVMVSAGIVWLVLSLNVLRRRTLRQLRRASSVTDLNRAAATPCQVCQVRLLSR